MFTLSCKCSTRRVDELCIVAYIENWEAGERCSLCKGCYTNQPSKRDHLCIGFCGSFLFQNTSPEEICILFGTRTKAILRDAETVNTLYSLYVEVHSDGTELKDKFYWGLQRLLETRLDVLVNILLAKDMNASFNGK